MNGKLLEEANTPSDGESIDASFNKDVSDEKFTPTVEFKKKYGPFKKVETLDLESLTLESIETNDETLTALRSIKGMVYAKKLASTNMKFA